MWLWRSAEKPNPQNTGGVDCANFVSQTLIAGGLDFNDSYGAESKEGG